MSRFAKIFVKYRKKSCKNLDGVGKRRTFALASLKNGAQEKAIFDRNYIKTEVVVQEASAGLPRARSFIIYMCSVLRLSSVLG